MKRHLALVSAILLLASLTSCGNSETLITGSVVPCNEIQLLEKAAQDLPLDCLDSSKTVNLAAIKGPAIINVWGSWCEPCKKELPHFSEFFQSMNPQIQLIGVDVEEKSAEDGRMFARTHGINWPNLYDEKGTTRKYFGMGVPVTWFIGSNGEVLYKKVGPIKSTEELRTLSFKYLGMS